MLAPAGVVELRRSYAVEHRNARVRVPPHPLRVASYRRDTMETKQRQRDTERDPDVVMYHRADCTEHPDSERHLRHEPTHFRSREVAIGGDPVQSRELFEEIVPETCSCGAAIESDFRTVEWPAIPMTTEAAMGLFRRTDGYVVLRVKSLNYPEEHVDWQSILGIDDPAREREWYLGMVGDRLVTRTRYDHQPIWSATEFTPDQLGVLLRKLPSEPKSIWDSELSGLLEDYQAGHELTAGVKAP